MFAFIACYVKIICAHVGNDLWEELRAASTSVKTGWGSKGVAAKWMWTGVKWPFSTHSPSPSVFLTVVPLHDLDHLFETMTVRMLTEDPSVASFGDLSSKVFIP